MTDNEIIKGLKCLSGDEIFCKDCAFSHLEGHGFACKKNVANAVLDLINRQKEEIERLKSKVNRLEKYDEERDIRLHARLTETARTEAIKEFAERLTERIFNCSWADVYEHIDNLVREMTGKE